MMVGVGQCQNYILNEKGFLFHQSCFSSSPSPATAASGRAKKGPQKPISQKQTHKRRRGGKSRVEQHARQFSKKDLRNSTHRGRGIFFQEKYPPPKKKVGAEEEEHFHPPTV